MHDALTVALLGFFLGMRHATDPDHVRQNAAAAEIVLTAADLAHLDAAFPPPRRKSGLEMI